MLVGRPSRLMDAGITRGPAGPAVTAEVDGEVAGRCCASHASGLASSAAARDHLQNAAGRACMCTAISTVRSFIAPPTAMDSVWCACWTNS